MKHLFLVCFLIFNHFILAQEVQLPIHVSNRVSLSELSLTDIGSFGIRRKARPNVKSHLHTGIDIQRPGNNYMNNPVFPIAGGVVISKRDDGPYAQIIVEHKIAGILFWSVYEHISGIVVELNEVVHHSQPIARFMNQKELDRYGWQFDHFHLEVLKVRPMMLKPTQNLPERRFSSYTLICYEQKDLFSYFYHPIEFFEQHFNSIK